MNFGLTSKFTGSEYTATVFSSVMLGAFNTVRLASAATPERAAGAVAIGASVVLVIAPGVDEVTLTET